MPNGRHVDRTVVVTGAASGIGRGIAHRFGAEGANVVVAESDGPRRRETYDSDVTTPADGAIGDETPDDATGAGDAFLAAVIAAVSHGVRDPGRALALADAAGAVATARAGAVTALTGPDALRRFHDELPWLSEPASSEWSPADSELTCA